MGKLQEKVAVVTGGATSGCSHHSRPRKVAAHSHDLHRVHSRGLEPAGRSMTQDEAIDFHRQRFRSRTSQMRIRTSTAMNALAAMRNAWIVVIETPQDGCFLASSKPGGQSVTERYFRT